MCARTHCRPPTHTCQSSAWFARRMERSEEPEYLIKTHLQLRLLTACSEFFSPFETCFFAGFFRQLTPSSAFAFAPVAIDTESFPCAMVRGLLPARVSLCKLGAGAAPAGYWNAVQVTKTPRWQMYLLFERSLLSDDIYSFCFREHCRVGKSMVSLGAFLVTNAVNIKW